MIHTGSRWEEARPASTASKTSTRMGESTVRETWTFHSAGQLLFGRNAVKQLGEVAHRLRLKRVLIVTDKILERTGIADRVRGPLTEAGVTVATFDGGEPEPSFRAAGACLDQARTFGPDGLLGLGGGSNMDLAKIAST